MCIDKCMNNTGVIMKNKKMKRRLLGSLLAVAMLAPSTGNVLADPPAGGQTDNFIKSTATDKLYEGENGENTYYKYPNWSEESVSNQGLTKWDLAPGQSLRSINNMSEPQETGQLNYKGYHYNTNGELILDLIYTWVLRSESGVWANVSLFVSPDLNKKINWVSSFYEDNYNNSKHNFERGKYENEKRMNRSYMCQFALAGNIQHTPIRLNLGKIQFKDLEKIDTTIQSRITNKDNTQIYAKYIGNTKGSNLLIDGYGSFTQSTSIPKLNSPNLQKGLLPFLRTSSVGDSDVTPNVVGGQGNISYSPDDEKLFIASQWKKGPSSNDVRFSGEPIGYRLAFAEELLDALKEDENGYIGYVEPSTTSGAQAANNKNNYRTGFKKTDVNIDKSTGMAYVIYSSNGFAAGSEKVITTEGGTAGFLDTGGTILTGQQYTLTTLNVDSERLKTLYPSLQRRDGLNFKPEMMPLDTYSSIVVSNSKGMEYVDTKTTDDISAAKGTEVKIVFAKSPADSKTGNAWYDAARIALKLGNLPIFGDLGIYARSAAGSLYQKGIFTYSDRKDGYKTYTTKLPVDFKLDKGSSLKLFAGIGGDLINNSAKIYIGGKEVASFNNGDAKKSFSPRAVIGTESISSTLLERAQYMPAIKETFDGDLKIEGFNFTKNQLVRLSYFDNNNNKIKTVQTVGDDTPAQGASYKIGSVTYPANNEQALYNYTANIEDGDKILKDSPLIARTYNYQAAKNDKSRAIADDETAIKSAVSSDFVIAKVQSVVTFDLNGGELKETDENPIKSFEGYTDSVNRQFNYKTKRDNSNYPIKRILPLNKKFSTQEGYKPNGFEGDDVELKDNEGFDLTGDALELRNFPTKKDENGVFEGPVPEKPGLSFLGWTTKPLHGDVSFITEEFEKLEKATSLEQVKDEQKNFIFTEKTPVDKSITVYAVYGAPSIRIHSNFDANDTQEGLQETIDKQALNSDTVDELMTKKPSEVSVKLDEVYHKEGFSRKGYSLVGFSRDKNAKEPDINVTGAGLTQDLYLRDGDTFKLADKGDVKTKTGKVEYDYKFEMQKGLDLYAVWKKDFTVEATKKWLDKDNNPITPTAEQLKDLEFGLICRPAVGTFGYEVVVQGATYYPLKGSERPYDPNGIKWENLKGYDTKGRRMSYIVIELKTPKQKAAFKNGSVTWSDYGLKIEEKKDKPDGTVEHYGRKTQYIELGNSEIDAYSSATERKHKSDTHPEGVAAHGGVTLGYFDTTGYIIDVKNNQWDLLPPTIDQAYVADEESKNPDKDNKVFINPPKRQLNEITITLPGGKKIVMIPPARLDTNKNYAQYVVQSSEDSDYKVEQNDKGQIVLSPKDPVANPLKANDKYKAIGAIIAGEKRTTQESEMTVKDRLVSNKVTDIKQDKLTDNNEVPIKFVVPEPKVTDKPIAGTVYTVLIKDKNGTITKTNYTYTIPVDDAARIPGTTQTILVPKSELLDGKKIIIKAKEPYKKSANSDEFTPDVVGPTVTTGTVKDERWRRWTKVDLDFNEAPEGEITITYTLGNETKTETAPSKSQAKVIIERLKLNPNVKDIKISAADKLGNKEDSNNVTYKPIGQTVIRIQKPLRNRNFVYVTATEANTKVTITVYNPGTILDNYSQDEYFNYQNIPSDMVKHTQVVTFDQAGRKKIILDNSYKFATGDVVDIVGRIGTQGQDGFKITNPYTWIVK